MEFVAMHMNKPFGTGDPAGKPAMIGLLLVLLLGLPAANPAWCSAATPAPAVEFLKLDEDFQTSPALPPDVMPGQVIVRFRPQTTRLAKQSALNPIAAGIRFFGRSGNHPKVAASLQGVAGPESCFDQLALVTLKQTVTVPQALARFRRQPEVLYAEPNFRLHLTGEDPVRNLPNDFDFDKLWSLRNTDQPGGADIRAVEAWHYGTGSRRVKVAVIDTGMDYFHPDLAANIETTGDIPGNGTDDDGNGYADDVHGYDFVSHDGDPLDDHDHGTHVAGIIGAVGDNNIGISGVCWNVTLMALKAFNEAGDASMDNVVEAIEYAIDNGAQIINASWGHSDKSRALADAVAAADAAGILVVAAAGNENSDAPFYPAALDHVISVAATGRDDHRTRFSNYGARIDVAAPGELIYSTLPDNSYDYFSGTSMSAPHVTGLAALVLSDHPEFSNRDIANILRNAVDPVLIDGKPIGTGRINAAKAVQIDKPLPFVKLELPPVIYGIIPINGAARGTNFIRYQLEYGTGADPAEWTKFHSSTTPVETGVLFDRFSTPQLDEGIHSFRITAENVSGYTSTERTSVSVRNVHIDFPLDNDILRAGETLAIRGTVFGENRSYRIEFGKGTSPAVWSDAGITLTEGGAHPLLDGTLASWDTHTLEPDAFYSLRLTATSAGKPAGEQTVRNVYFDSHLKPGWPQYLPITGTFPTNDWRNITVADLNGDGTRELITVDPGNLDGKPARLLVYKFDGTLLWARELASGAPYSDVPVVGDIDGDGRQEIFVDVGDKGEVFGFHGDGTPLAGDWPVHLDATNLGKTLADLDGDGSMELIAYSHDTVERFGTDMRQLVVISAEGKIIRNWYVGDCDTGVDAGKIFPAVANLDNDPGLEIVVPSGCQTLAAFSLSKPDGPLWSASVEGQLVSSAVIGDINGDGTNEIVIGSYDEKKNGSGALFVFDHTGRRFSGWPVLQGDSFASPPALADLDGDGTLEICILGVSSELMHVVHHYGFEMSGWPVGPIGNSSVRTSPVIGDIDGDGNPDVVIASPGYLLLALTYGDTSYLGGIRAWNAGGNPIPLTRTFGSLLMEGSGGAWHKSAPVTIADIDNNGKLDLIAASIQDRTFSQPGDRGGRKNRSSIYVWELDAPFDAAKMPWPMLQGNARHTGHFPIPKHENQPPIAAGIPDQTIPTGGRFVPLDLAGFVEDSDNSPRQITWSVSGNGELKATVSATGLLTVDAPGATWTGSETLRFVATDPGGLRSETSAVYSARDGYVPPVAVEDQAATLEDQPVEITPLANDLNPNGGTLAVLSFSRPRLGKVTRTPQGTLLFTPNAYAHGLDEFTYTLGDGKGGLAIGSVKLSVTHVNHPPEPEVDYAILDEDTSAVIDLLANDKDPDGDPFALISFSEPAHGALERLPDGTLRYTPEKRFFGADNFSYKIADSFTLEGRADVNILVKHVNHPPDGPDLDFTLNRNSSLDIVLAAEDPDQDDLSFKIVRGPEHGEILAYPAIAGYSPKKGYSGNDSFTYRANDGQSDSREITVNLTVTDKNNPPRIGDQSLITRRDRNRPVQLSATDADGDPISFRILTFPGHGALSGMDGDYTYKPEPGFLGMDGFTVEASDGVGGTTPGHIEIKVTDQNTPPVASGGTLKVRSDTPTSATLNATDPEADPMTFTILSPPLNGALSGAAPKLTYTPNAGFTGPDRFTFKAGDGELESAEATVTLSIEPLNHPPVATNQTIHVERNTSTRLSLAVTDEDGDPLASPILKGPKHGRLFGRGTAFTYVPNPDYVGDDEFTYKVWDQHTYSKPARVSITVAPAPPDSRPSFGSVQHDGSGQLRLTLNSQPGKNYEISVSTNLVDWVPLLKTTANGASISITDTNGPGSAARFYRAVRE
jgi:subtilisin family serine protease